MSYADRSVIWEGALDEDRIFYAGQETELDQWASGVIREAQAQGAEIQVYALWHEHEITEEECSCSQYVTDGRPQYSTDYSAEDD